MCIRPFDNCSVTKCSKTVHLPNTRTSWKIQNSFPVRIYFKINAFIFDITYISSCSVYMYM